MRLKASDWRQETSSVNSESRVQIYFSDVFGIAQQALHEYGAFNVSLITDLPLFIDPFPLFKSEDETYQGLHESIIEYMRFLKTVSVGEVMQTTAYPGAARTRR